MVKKVFYFTSGASHVSSLLLGCDDSAGASVVQHETRDAPGVKRALVL